MPTLMSAMAPPCASAASRRSPQRFCGIFYVEMQYLKFTPPAGRYENFSVAAPVASTAADTRACAQCGDALYDFIGMSAPVRPGAVAGVRLGLA